MLFTFICLFPGSRVTTDQRVVAKQEIQEVESAKRAGAPYAYAHHEDFQCLKQSQAVVTATSRGASGSNLRSQTKNRSSFELRVPF